MSGAPSSTRVSPDFAATQTVVHERFGHYTVRSDVSRRSYSIRNERSGETFGANGLLHAVTKARRLAEGAGYHV